MKTALRLVSLSLAFSMAILPAALGQSRVGVTSATTGGPLGKPPADVERVLHVGVDIQANELVSTGASDRAHLLFLDGSSLTVGPQARLVIDRFIYDPDKKIGGLAVSATQGVFRFVGGRISKTTPVVVTTPSATISIRGGILLLNVEPTQTTATFMFGTEMTVTAHGQTQTVKRPGWQVVVGNGQVPGQPAQAPPGSLSPEFQKLEGMQNRAGIGIGDEAVQSSGFAQDNSGLGATGLGGSAALNTVNLGTRATVEADMQFHRPLILQQATSGPSPGGGGSGGGGRGRGN